MLPVIMLHVLFIYLPCAWNSWLIKKKLAAFHPQGHISIYIYIDKYHICMYKSSMVTQSTANHPGKTLAGLVGLTPFLLHPELLIQRHRRKLGLFPGWIKDWMWWIAVILDSWNFKKRLIQCTCKTMLIHKQYMYRVFFTTCRVSFFYKYIYVIIIYDATPIPTQLCCVFCFCFCSCFLMLWL